MVDLVAMGAPAWVRARRWTRELPFAMASVRAARRALDADLAGAGVGPTARADARVVLSELVANSVRHARPVGEGCLRVLWTVTGSHVGLAVGDAGAPTRPTPIKADGSAQSGRGLAIIDALAEDWGVEGARTDDQVVWAVLGTGTLAARGC